MPVCLQRYDGQENSLILRDNRQASHCNNTFLKQSKIGHQEKCHSDRQLCHRKYTYLYHIMASCDAVNLFVMIIQHCSLTTLYQHSTNSD